MSSTIELRKQNIAMLNTKKNKWGRGGGQNNKTRQDLKKRKNKTTTMSEKDAFKCFHSALSLFLLTVTNHVHI